MDVKKFASNFLILGIILFDLFIMRAYFLSIFCMITIFFIYALSSFIKLILKKPITNIKKVLILSLTPFFIVSILGNGYNILLERIMDNMRENIISYQAKKNVYPNSFNRNYLGYKIDFINMKNNDVFLLAYRFNMSKVNLDIKNNEKKIIYD